MVDRRNARKGKTYEEIYGIEKAKDLKRKSSERRKGKTHLEIYGENSYNLRKRISRTLFGKHSGKNNPFFGKKHTLKSIEIIRNSKLGKSYEEMYGKEKSESIKNKQRKEIKPKNYHTEYDDKFFDVDFRQQILKEQSYLCGICLDKLKGRYKKNLHHINYIKKDNRRRNLMYLCVSCHTKTNYNRNAWKKYLRLLNAKLLENYKLSRKIIFRVKKKLNLKEKNILLDSGGY